MMLLFSLLMLLSFLSGFLPGDHYFLADRFPSAFQADDVNPVRKCGRAQRGEAVAGGFSAHHNLTEQVADDHIARLRQAREHEDIAGRGVDPE